MFCINQPHKALVIGNGITVNKQFIQENEDNFQYVVRMNDFEIEGQDVGQRTTIWAVNTNEGLNRIRSRNRNNLNKKDIMIIVCCDDAGKVQSSEKIYKDQGFERVISAIEVFTKVMDCIRHRPTIGLAILRYMLDYYKSEVVATGFDLMHHYKADCLHYWGKLDGKRYGQWYPHDKNKELNYLYKLQDEGVVFV